MTLHTYNPHQCPYQVSTSHTLQFPRYGPDNILWVKVTMAGSKVKSRSHHDDVHLQPVTMSLPSINFLHLPTEVISRSLHDDAHLQPVTNVLTKYELPTPYSFRYIAQTRFYSSRSLWEGQRLNKGQTMT